MGERRLKDFARIEDYYVASIDDGEGTKTTYDEKGDVVKVEHYEPPIRSYVEGSRYWRDEEACREFAKWLQKEEWLPQDLGETLEDLVLSFMWERSGRPGTRPT